MAGENNIYQHEFLEIKNVGGIANKLSINLKSYLVLESKGRVVRLPIIFYGASFNEMLTSGTLYRYIGFKNHETFVKLYKNPESCIARRIENYGKLTYVNFDNETKVQWFHDGVLLDKEPEDLKQQYLGVLDIYNENSFSLDGIQNYLKLNEINFVCNR